MEYLQMLHCCHEERRELERKVLLLSLQSSIGCKFYAAIGTLSG